MNTIRAYLQALWRPFTYDVRRNLYFWFGVVWGLPIPLFSIGLDLAVGHHEDAGPWEVVWQHPLHVVFLVHPILFGLVFGAMGTVRHQLELENAGLIERLTALANTDSLTGLKNRRAVLDELQQAIRRAERTSPGPAIVLFDLDGVKAVNDRQGHLAGDVVLRKVGSSLRSVVRHGEVLGRYGGDEFLLVANGDLPDAQALIVRAVHAIVTATGLGASAGIARFPQDGNDPEQLIRRADERLQQAKKLHYETRGYARRKE